MCWYGDILKYFNHFRFKQNVSLHKGRVYLHPIIKSATNDGLRSQDAQYSCINMPLKMKYKPLN
jgi:hypothetical protein